MTFLDWLKLQLNRDDTIGYIALEVIEGAEKSDGLIHWLSMLIHSGFMKKNKLFSIQFMTAYNLYKFEVGHGDIEVECFFNER